jgi:hypothetical protein
MLKMLRIRSSKSSAKTLPGGFFGAFDSNAGQSDLPSLRHDG